ncbi:hypothetical protein HDV00_011858 [Rhizophlyctis rosea]|nr:hypothetical protein HDV00_011858 [Rhizophlyctis rosea]
MAHPPSDDEKWLSDDENVFVTSPTTWRQEQPVRSAPLSLSTAKNVVRLKRPGDTDPALAMRPVDFTQSGSVMPLGEGRQPGEPRMLEMGREARPGRRFGQGPKRKLDDSVEDVSNLPGTLGQEESQADERIESPDSRLPAASNTKQIDEPPTTSPEPPSGIQPEEIAEISEEAEANHTSQVRPPPPTPNLANLTAAHIADDTQTLIDSIFAESARQSADAERRMATVVRKLAESEKWRYILQDRCREVEKTNERLREELRVCQARLMRCYEMVRGGGTKEDLVEEFRRLRGLEVWGGGDCDGQGTKPPEPSAEVAAPRRDMRPKPVSELSEEEQLLLALAASVEQKDEGVKNQDKQRGEDAQDGADPEMDAEVMKDVIALSLKADEDDGKPTAPSRIDTLPSNVNQIDRTMNEKKKTAPPVRRVTPPIPPTHLNHLNPIQAGNEALAALRRLHPRRSISPPPKLPPTSVPFISPSRFPKQPVQAVPPPVPVLTSLQPDCVFHPQFGWIPLPAEWNSPPSATPPTPSSSTATALSPSPSTTTEMSSAPSHGYTYTSPIDLVIPIKCHDNTQKPLNLRKGDNVWEVTKGFVGDYRRRVLGNMCRSMYDMVCEKLEEAVREERKAAEEGRMGRV